MSSMSITPSKFLSKRKPGNFEEKEQALKDLIEGLEGPQKVSEMPIKGLLHAFQTHRKTFMKKTIRYNSSYTEG